jgi:hypothetical protein
VSWVTFWLRVPGCEYAREGHRGTQQGTVTDTRRLERAATQEGNGFMQKMFLYIDSILAPEAAVGSNLTLLAQFLSRADSRF